MKTKFILGLGFTLVCLSSVNAAETAPAQAPVGAPTSASTASEPQSGSVSKSPAKSKQKSTEVSFDDVLVQGKYHFSDEAVTTVEQDKVLDALLGVRTDFKDRLKKSSARH